MAQMNYELYINEHCLNGSDEFVAIDAETLTARPERIFNMHICEKNRRYVGFKSVVLEEWKC